jgi:hypothetical protein
MKKKRNKYTKEFREAHDIHFFLYPQLLPLVCRLPELPTGSIDSKDKTFRFQFFHSFPLPYLRRIKRP